MAFNKHVANDPRELVNESLAGLARWNPKIKVDAAHRVVSLKEIPQDRVALVSGGGSGHEPSHAGFVGQGLLTAAVAGNVFASPNVGQVRAGIEAVRNNKGTLVVIMRYTGDVLLFGLAKERAAVTNPDHPIRMTIVGDDVAVARKQGSLTGRRGLAGTVLVYKVASALADEGASLDEVADIADYMAERTGTIGCGLEHCHIPGTAKAEAHLGEMEAEIGMGIHNESGVEKIKLPSSKELVARMLKMITDTNDKERAYVPFKHDGKDEVILLVNNLGGLSELEMTSIANDAVLELEKGKIIIKRVIVGTVMTSLNLPGFSLTTMLLPRSGDKYSGETILKYMDAPASSPGWKYLVTAEPGVPQPAAPPKEEVSLKSGAAPVPPLDFALFQKAVTAACETVIKAEPEITKYDTIAGDGDCGLCLKAMASGIVKAFEQGKVDKQDMSTAILNLATVIEKEGDGTSGALYSLFFNGLAAAVPKVASDSKASNANAAVWAESASQALNTLYGYTAARRPSRTLVDPLSAFVEAYSKSKGADFGAALKAASEATENTKKIEANIGRASYVGQEELMKANVPDPGAYGVVKILEGIQSVIA